MPLDSDAFIHEAKKYDVVHIHTSYPYLKAAISGGLDNVVFTWHGYAPSIYVPGLKNKVVNYLLRHLYGPLLRKVRYVTAVSNYAATQLERMYGVKARVIYNGVDLELFRPCKERPLGAPVLLNVTAYNNLKGRDLLIRYYKVVKERYPSARLIAHGVGLKGSDIIDFDLVPQEELPSLYCKANIYLLTSRWESFGMPILEAFATGMPVVALYRDDARRELIETSGAGFLFKDAGQLMAAIKEVMENQGLYSLRGIEFSKRFDWSVIAYEYVKLYNEVLRGSHNK